MSSSSSHPVESSSSGPPAGTAQPASANANNGSKQNNKSEKKSKKDKDKESKPAPQANQPARAVIPIEKGGLEEKDGSYGDLVLVASSYEDPRVWVDIPNITPSIISQHIWCRARCGTVRGKGKSAFIVLRRGFYSVQCVIGEGVGGMTRDACKWSTKIPSESVIDVYGEVVAIQGAPTKTSQSEVEIRVHKIFVVSVSSSTLPFQLSDAARPMTEKEKAVQSAAIAKEEGRSGDNPVKTSISADGDGTSPPVSVDGSGTVITVGQDIRLDNRWLDLRTPANHAIFRISSRVCQYYRQFFLERDFIEIHTPKLTPGVSEGGAAVFRLSYFDREACLAQSPQLYKQMCVSSDLFKVFEIGPVFRAELSMTHRHMCEFTGMDFEMEIKQHYHEVLKVLGELFVFIFDSLNKYCEHELNAVNQQYPFSPLRYKKETLVIPFPDAIRMLQNAGEEIGDEDDFSTPQEKRLGKLVSEEYGVDFYIVDQYPLSARPFYTMPNPNNPRFTNSYDVFVRGEEITSGAQRIHDVDLLRRRAAECGIPESNIAAYTESFKYGAWPHGGAGIGLERVVMLFLGLDNIRKASLFPRTPNRLEP